MVLFYVSTKHTGFEFGDLGLGDTSRSAKITLFSQLEPMISRLQRTLSEEKAQTHSLIHGCNIVALV